MQRWFFADEAEVCVVYEEKVEASSEYIEPKKKPSVVYERLFTFCVKVQGKLCGNERVAITGDYVTLGKWQLSKIVLLQRNDLCPNMWKSRQLRIPRYKPTEYRYVIVAEDSTSHKYIVRRWETHLKPRLLPPQEMGVTTVNKQCDDVFGLWNGKHKVDRGWITMERIVQLTFVNTPITLRSKLKKRQFYIKVTPMFIFAPNECANDSLINIPVYKSFFGDDQSLDGSSDNTSHLSTAFAFCETAVLKAGQCKLRPQPKWGLLAAKKDILIFHLTIGDFERTAYLIDLYTYSKKAAVDEPPYHFAYYYIKPELLKFSSGHLKVPISCASTHRPLGFIQLNYMVIHPVNPPIKLDMRVSYLRYWNPEISGLEAGHRGCGRTFTDYEGLVRENTIYSILRAINGGADMIECDVQVSKDLVPVLHHDFIIQVSNLPYDPPDKHSFTRASIYDFTLEQLQLMRVSRFGENYFWLADCPVEGEDLLHQPFLTLEELLQIMDPYVALNIEIKWPQKYINKTWEELFSPIIDCNDYLDHILRIVFNGAGIRRIYFSSFSVNVCVMLRYKQHLYPVLHLFLYEYSNTTPYLDPRCASFDLVMHTALANELMGLVMPAGDLIRNPMVLSLIRANNLILFIWLRKNDADTYVQQAIDLDVQTIIYDKIDTKLHKSNLRSVFAIRAGILENCNPQGDYVHHKDKRKPSQISLNLRKDIE